MDSVVDSAMRLKPRGGGTWDFCARATTALIAQRAIDPFSAP